MEKHLKWSTLHAPPEISRNFLHISGNKNTSGDCLCYLKEHLWLEYAFTKVKRAIYNIEPESLQHQHHQHLIMVVFNSQLVINFREYNFSRKYACTKWSKFPCAKLPFPFHEHLQKCIAKPYSLLINDCSLASDNKLCFRKNLLEIT